MQFRFTHNHTHSVTHLLYDKTGQYLLSVGADSSVQVMDASILACYFKKSFVSQITCASWALSGFLCTLVLGFEDGSIALCFFNTDRNDDVSIHSIVSAYIQLTRPSRCLKNASLYLNTKHLSCPLIVMTGLSSRVLIRNCLPSSIQACARFLHEFPYRSLLGDPM